MTAALVSSDIGALFVRESRSLLAANFAKIQQSFARLSDDDVWWRPNDASNSAGNLVLHLCGNVTQWIVGGVGGHSRERNRQAEFDERGPIPKSDLLNRLEEVVKQADVVLEHVSGVDLSAGRRIQGYDVSVLAAIYHVVEHFGMHTGQIILIAKARAGEDLRLWEPPPSRP